MLTHVDMLSQIHLYHVEFAFRQLFPDINGDCTSPMPQIDRLPPHRTRYWPLKPILINENSNENNIKIIENIFENQFNLPTDSSVYANEFRLIGGDLKTWQRVISIKRMRSGISDRPFDRFDWVLPNIGLWHLRFNLLQLIHRLHWGGGGKSDVNPSTLQYAADRWDRNTANLSKDFAKMEELIIHSYQSRMISALVMHANQEGAGIESMDDMNSWLASQSQQQWVRMLLKVSKFMSLPTPIGPPETLPPELDEQLANHQRFCFHVEVYLTLSHAIKHADIGLLRHALRLCAVIMQSGCAGMPKYAPALLYVLHLVDSLAASPQLQRCVLANSLVNLQGGVDSNFELDRLLELINNNLRAYQTERAYYAISSDELLQGWALNAHFLQQIRLMVEASFGQPNSGVHADKSATEDMGSGTQPCSRRLAAT